MIDKVMLSGDKGTRKVEQIQVREAKGDRDRVREGLHRLFSFEAR
jgi:hypothetical protein